MVREILPYAQQEHFIVGGLTWASLGGSALLLCAAIMCAIASWRDPAQGRAWLGVALVASLLLAYRMAGMEHALGDTLREMARDEQWYDARRLIQASVTIAVVLVGIAMAALTFHLGSWPGWHPALFVSELALALLALLYVIRLVSLHLVDAFLYSSVGPLRVNWLLEAGLLGALIIAAGRVAFYGGPAQRR